MAAGAGKGVVIASTYDGPVGIAAAVHVAAALQPPPLACGLATLALFDWRRRRRPPTRPPGRITVPAFGPVSDSDSGRQGTIAARKARTRRAAARNSVRLSVRALYACVSARLPRIAPPRLV